jgi:hypothetical protein
MHSKQSKATTNLFLFVLIILPHHHSSEKRGKGGKGRGEKIGERYQ